jgi:NADH dehydrogenase
MRVAVLGAGYAGLTLARQLEDGLPDAEVVVVDENPDHLLLHELHRVIRRPSVLDAITVPLEDALDRATVRTARVESVDADARRVELVDPVGGAEPHRVDGTDGDGERERERRELTYDYAGICLGSETAFYDIPGLEEQGTPLKRIAHAERIRSDFLDLCETGGRAVVGGAGLSGIQVAGELHALAVEEGVRRDVEVVLVEQLPEIASNFPANFRSAVREELADRNVEIRTDTAVTEATADDLELNDGDERLAYDQLVWTGGIRGPNATGGERLGVRGDLRVTRETFAVGDAARAVDADGQPVPASASAAIREARTVADNVRRLAEHDRAGDPDAFEPRLEPYRFDVPGWIVSVGDGAVAQLGPTVLTGSAAKAMKATVGAGHLSSVGAIEKAARLVEEELGS